MYMENRSDFKLNCGQFCLDLNACTHIMGILNVTPDSFSDGGLFFDTDKAVAHGESMAEEGADIIDIGGESTRPFSEPVPEEEEIRRVIPVIEKLAPRVSVPISIDTTKARVAQYAIEAGATMINDISALRLDPRMGDVAAKAGVPVVLMHMQGTPKTMQESPYYEDVIQEIKLFLVESIKRAEEFGIERGNIIVDPGIGFGKTVAHNLSIIKHIHVFKSLGVPLLLGVSRKSFITKILGNDMEQRENGTQAVLAIAAMNGVEILRVHDVRRAYDTLRIVDEIKNAD